MLALSHSDQTLVTSVVDSLVSPLDFSDRHKWRRKVTRTLQPLIGADVVSFILPFDGRADIYCEQRSDDVWKYPGYMQSEEVAERFHERVRALQVAARETAWGSDIATLPRTMYWNEFVRPLRLFDSLTMCVPTGPKPRLEDTAQIIFNHDSPRRAGFAHREIAIARLLFPAMKSGVYTWLRLRDARHAFAVRIDDLCTPIALFDLSGRELHRNDALRELLASEPHPDDVMAAGTAMARSHGGLDVDRMTSSGINGSMRQVVRTTRARYLLQAARIGPAVSTYSEAVVITVQRDARKLPSHEAVRTKFGLTERQAAVALLLAERKTNPEIADALCISPHTARHHTEAVMDKLGVSDRREVRCRLVG